MTTKTQTFQVRLDVEFSDEDIDLNIMGSGFPIYEWWYSIEDDPDGYVIAAEHPDEDGIFSKTITYDDIRRVMGNMLADAYPKPQYYYLAKKQIMDSIRTGDWDLDAEAADEIMQVAFYGSVMFS